MLLFSVVTFTGNAIPFSADGKKLQKSSIGTNQNFFYETKLISESLEIQFQILPLCSLRVFLLLSFVSIMPSFTLFLVGKFKKILCSKWENGKKRRVIRSIPQHSVEILHSDSIQNTDRFFFFFFLIVVSVRRNLQTSKN